MRVFGRGFEPHRLHSKIKGYRMKVLLGKSKVGSGGKSLKTFKASIPLVVAENLHVVAGSYLFIYLEGSRIYLETVKRDASSYGIYKEACYLGSKSLATQGAVLCFSFAHVLREVLGLSSGNYLGFYYEEGRIYIEKYVETF